MNPRAPASIGTTPGSRAPVRTVETGMAPLRAEHRPAPPPAPRRASLPDDEAPRIARSRAHARRHSLFVALMKGLLPTLAVGLIAAFVFYSQGGFSPNLPRGFDFDPGQLDLSSGGVKMVSPKLTGLDQENQRFEVTAATAVQDAANPGLITLESISGRMQLTDGGWVRVDADGGFFNSDESMLTLEDAIEVTMSTGYVARLNGAVVDFKAGRVDTDQPVLVFMNAGIITGNAMTIFDKGSRVRFTGGTSMTINGEAARESEGQGGTLVPTAESTGSVP